jgi:RNA polymerase sigma-70 factor, ECF subfamily
MLIVWHKAGQFDPARASAATWIFTIARNLRIDLKRRERGQGSGEDLNADLANPLPCDHMLSQQRDAQIHAALKTLSYEQAEVIRLAFFEDWPHADIAAALDIPLGTVKSRIRLAMARLRALVEDLK